MQTYYICLISATEFIYFDEQFRWLIARNKNICLLCTMHLITYRYFFTARFCRDIFRVIFVGFIDEVIVVQHDCYFATLLPHGKPGKFTEAYFFILNDSSYHFFFIFLSFNCRIFQIARCHKSLDWHLHFKLLLRKKVEFSWFVLFSLSLFFFNLWI